MIFVKFRRKRSGMPPIIVVPMIDIMFFLLVFFMLSTMYMTNVKSVPVQFSNLSHGLGSQNVSFAVSVDEEGKIFIGDTPVDRATLSRYAAREAEKNADGLILLRTDKRSPYDSFAQVIETLRKSGVSRFGIATEMGD